uniref:vesicle-fusing ATPase-like n=1 Tax=Myxine glutinosa TaxID=7769 RepID=UPI00358E4708
MAARDMKVSRCPTDELSLTNCAVVHESERTTEHVIVHTSPTHGFVFTLKSHQSVVPKTIAFSLPQRKWAGLSLTQEVQVRPFQFDKTKQCIGTMTIEVDFLQKKHADSNPYDSDQMATEFLQQFVNQAFTVKQQLVFNFINKLFTLTVKEIDAVDTTSILKQENVSAKLAKINTGLSLPNTHVIFEKSENSTLNLTGKSKTQQGRQSIINPDWNFEKMGIGGLDREFSDIFRRAFASVSFHLTLWSRW